MLTANAAQRKRHKASRQVRRVVGKKPNHTSFNSAILGIYSSFLKSVIKDTLQTKHLNHYNNNMGL